MHHAPQPRVVCLTLHRFTKIAEGFKQKSERFTPYYTLSHLAHRNMNLRYYLKKLWLKLFFMMSNVNAVICGGGIKMFDVNGKTQQIHITPL